MRIQERWNQPVQSAATGSRRTWTLLTPVAVTVFGLFTAAVALLALSVDSSLELGFAFNSISLVCPFTPLYVLAHVWELESIEEPELVMRLGVDYVEYRRRTPMFIPGLRRRSGSTRSR